LATTLLIADGCWVNYKFKFHIGGEMCDAKTEVMGGGARAQVVYVIVNIAEREKLMAIVA